MKNLLIISIIIAAANGNLVNSASFNYYTNEPAEESPQKLFLDEGFDITQKNSDNCRQ